MQAIGVIYFDFVALNKEGVKNAFHLHYSQYKINTASVYKVRCFRIRSKQPFCKKIKVVSIEPLKQTLSLRN